MSVQAITDEVERLRKLLRLAVAAVPAPLPNRLQTWWDEEQLVIAAEQEEVRQRKERRRTELQARITALQAELDAL